MTRTEPQHKNVFCKKYANCRGKSKKAKQNRAKLELEKLYWRKKRSISKLMTAKIEKEIAKLLKTKKLSEVTNKEIEDIKNKVKMEVMGDGKAKDVAGATGGTGNGLEETQQRKEVTQEIAG